MVAAPLSVIDHFTDQFQSDSSLVTLILHGHLRGNGTGCYIIMARAWNLGDTELIVRCKQKTETHWQWQSEGAPTYNIHQERRSICIYYDAIGVAVRKQALLL